MAATLVLVACGLVASGVAVTTILQHSLMNRVDDTLLDASRGWAQVPRRLPVTPIDDPNPARPPSDFFVRGIDPDGQIWMAVNDRVAEPALPADNNVGPVPVTVGSVDHSDVQWRAMTVRGLGGELTTVAIDLTGCGESSGTCGTRTSTKTPLGSSTSRAARSWLGATPSFEFGTCFVPLPRKRASG